MNEELDRISELPRDIMNQILLRLPIKEAIRTSVLSSSWRYKWNYVPNLVFDEFDDFDDQWVWGIGGWQLVKEDLGTAILETLTTHHGPLKKFGLSIRRYPSTSLNISPCFDYLSTSFVEEIAFNNYTRLSSQIPDSLFNCRYLLHLKLQGCEVIIPPWFEEFKQLISLSLHRVKMIRATYDSPNPFKDLISHCPQLKHLTVKDLRGISRGDLEAPNLESLDFGGNLFHVSVVGVMERLKSVTESLNDCHYNLHCGSTNLPIFFRDFPNIQILRIESSSLKYLALQMVPLPALARLECLFTSIDFHSTEEILTVISLMRSSPQLKKVEFKGRIVGGVISAATSETMADFWKEDHSCCLEQVQIVSIDYISGTEAELELVKFLLASSPKAEKITIQLSVCNGEVAKKLMQLPRASTQTRLIIQTYHTFV